MNRLELQQLADDRVSDAVILLSGQRWSAAYYLAGYSVECAFKACIAGKVLLHDFPDKDFVNNAYTHKLSRLLELANLDLPLKLDTTPVANIVLGRNWQVVKDWSEASRYQQISEEKARRLFDAVTHPTNGVLPWIKLHW